VSTSEALIIGAGPFGLSISAHLRGLDVDHDIVGRPVDTWRAHMPVGMNLKSEPYASDMSSPKAGYDVAAYCRSRGLDHVARGGPLSLQRFLGYADWYTEELVPNVSDVTVTEVNAVDGGFLATFAESGPVAAKKVVIATGPLPYSHIPAELSSLPSDLVSHSADHHQFDRFRGRRVAVVGAGQSALETAALLHEAGAVTQLVVRRSALSWHPTQPPLPRLGQIRRPLTKLCEGWRCAFWNSPAAFRRLPQDVRMTKARTVLGPCGAWWLRDRVEGVVEVLSGYTIRGAESSGSCVRLLLDGPERSTIDVDHVIAGTGFRVDISRLAFLPAELRRGITTINGYPMVTRVGESTVPGLYFVGAPTAISLGPSARFIAGTHNIASKLARSVARHSKANGGHSTASLASAHLARSSDNAEFQETT
jgi:hypothetical protein